MSLNPGARLDGYEILGPLGSGGMGEVYRARDSVLKREVAIKVLPNFVSQDPDRLRRFQQEAQAAAALNHPNILAVFQFGTFEGSPYLVSELLEGDTLRQLLQRGPLAVRKAIDGGVQVAHGLAAAHDKGIVHRDLKPENLFVTKDGRVKILDFGLAKLTQRPPESGDSGPTLTHQGTDPGLILGTVGYMSPEQVRGHAADSRADIFSLGAILYEMVAGKRAFQRATSAETMTAILNEDPPGISQIVQNTPPGLQRVVHRCLEKSPEQRFQSASDLAFALEAISESGISGPVANPAPIRLKSRKLFLWSGFLVAVLALATTTAYFLARRQQHVPFEHYSIQKAIESKHVSMVAISPDGSYLASVIGSEDENQALWVHHIATNSERPILQEATYKYLDITFSPDGNYIYFRIDALGTPKVFRRDVYRVSVLGGQATRVLEDVDSPLSFIDGGQRVCFYRQDSAASTYKFLNASAEGGDEQVLANGKKPFLYSRVCAPNGRFAVFSDPLGVQSLDFDSGRKQTLASFTTIGSARDLHWTPDGRGLFAISESAIHPNGQIGLLSYPGGIWRQITNDLSDYWGVSLTSNERTIATTAYEFNERFGVLSLTDPSHINEYQIEGLFWFTWLDNDRIVESNIQSLSIIDLVKNEKTSISVAKGHFYVHPALCGPDMLVVSAGSSDGVNAGVYKMHLDGSGLTQLTKGPVDYFPECTSDGKWLFYADNRDRLSPLLMRQSLQGGAAQIAAKGFRHNVSPDGKFLVAVATVPLQIISTDSLKVVRTLPLGDVANTFAFSADGKSVFYDTRTGADTTIWQQPLDAATAVKIASLPGKNVSWIRPSPDGKKLGLVIATPTSEAVLIRDVR